MRDDFTKKTKENLAKRVNFICSNPDCRLATTGPHTDSEQSVNKGVAAHITAAAPGGKRYDDSLTAEERSGAENGLWLCQNCAKLIDSDEDRFPTDLLQAWKIIAESSARHSIETNSPLLTSSPKQQIKVRGSYAGGNSGTRATLDVFNGLESPIYLSAWYAEWDDQSAESSIECVKGELPFRLQTQDTHTLTIDLLGFSGLTKLAVCDGNNQYFYVGDTELANIVADAKRYSSLIKTPDQSDLTEQLQGCNVEINAMCQNTSSGKQLVITFTNKSEIPIPLIGGEIEWKYNPPRQRGDNPQVTEVSGTVSLVARTDLSRPVPKGGTAEFHVARDVACCLVETLFEDVGYEDIAIKISTNANTAWTANEDEIPAAVREFALHLVDSRQPRSK